MIKSKLSLLAMLAFAFAAALPAAAADITIVAPTVGTSTETSIPFQISVDKPLTSAYVDTGLINGGFEDGNLNYWTTGGDAEWVAATNTAGWTNAAKQGGYFAHSPLAGQLTGEGKTSWLERTITNAQTSSLMFFGKAYLRYGNYVALTLDGAEIDRYNSTDLSSWTKKEYVIPAGQHAVRFTYYRNIDQNASYEAFLLDQFRWSSQVLTQPLTVANSEDGLTATAVGNVTFVPGIIDYRVRVIDTDSVTSYSPVSQMKTFSAPTITILGANPVAISIEDIGSYVDQGAVAYDMFDGDLTSSISVSREGFSAALGNSHVYYRVTNSAGKEAVADRIVDASDMTPPVITLNGDLTTSTEKFIGSWTDPGVTVTDNCSGPFGLTLATSSDFDINTEGVYAYVYSAKDEYGNTAYATRTINVIDTLPPRIYGVENGAFYNVKVMPQFDEGTATLNGEAFASDTTIDIAGKYDLVVTDAHGLKTSASFTLILTGTTSAGGSSSSGSSSSGGGSSANSDVSVTTIVFSTPSEPVVLPKSKAEVLGVKYSATSQVSTANIKLKANGTLIRASNYTVYVIVNRQKKVISSLSELQKYKNKKIYDVVDAELAMYPDWRPYGSNVLLRAVSGKIYLAQKDGTKYLIESLDELKKFGKLKTYRNVSDANLSYYPLSTELYVAATSTSAATAAATTVTTAAKYPANVLLRSASGQIYLVLKNSAKYYISSLEELAKYKKLKLYRNISDTVLSQYADAASAE